MTPTPSRIREKLRLREQEGNLRELPAVAGIDFSSNDYLGLARNTELQAIIAAAHENTIGTRINGSTGSRLLSGNDPLAVRLEKKLAGLFNAEAVLLFNSGYSANLSLLSAIPQKGDTILYDECIHASLKDGARLSFANRHAFRHNDLNDLQNKLSKATGDVFVVVESVYSMDGDVAPLEAVAAVCTATGAYLIVDEAHSTGIWGEGGSGLVCEQGLEEATTARVYTFGKAMGVHGACIAGSAALIRYLINFARPFIYTTALPSHSIVSIKAAFDYVAKHPELAAQLKTTIDYFRKKIAPVKPELLTSKSGIQVVPVPGNKHVVAAAMKLQEQGYDVRAIKSPTVKAGEERLRICLHAYNTKEEVDGLVGAL